MEHLCLGAFHKAHALDHTDLTLVKILGVRILMGVLPARIVGEIVGAVGVNDAGVGAVDLFRVLVLQRADGALDALHRHIMVAGGIAAAKQITGIHGIGAVLHVGAAAKHLTGDGIQRSARLRAEQLGRHDQIVIHGGEQQQVGELHVAAVLVHRCLDHAHIQALTRGGHSLGKGFGQLGQRIVLAELDRLAAMLRDGMLLSKLIVDQIGLGIVDQIVGVVGAHLLREPLPRRMRGHGAGGDIQLTCSGVDVLACAEQLQVKIKCVFFLHSFSFLWRNEVRI